MPLKTIILCDKDTQMSQNVINTVQCYFNVFCTSTQHIPELPRKNVAATLVLCLKPDDDSLRFIERVRLIFPSTPILLMSPSPQPEDVTLAIQSGVTGYQNLPFDEEKLLSWLEEHTKIKSETSVWAWLKKLLFPQLVMPQQTLDAHNVASHLKDLASKVSQVIRSTQEADSASMNVIQASFFGSLKVEVNKQPLYFRGNINGLLLAFILYQYPKPVHRQRLIEKFWPHSSSDAARNCLNTTIHSLRKIFGENVGVTPILMFHNEHYSIHPDWAVESDVLKFKFHREKALEIERTQGLKMALADYLHLKEIYVDDFLINYPNHEWVLGVRDNFREKYIQMLIHLGAFYQKDQKYINAIEQFKAILDIDDAIESAHRGVMECYSVLRMKDEGIKQYERCKQCLRRLNMTVSKETTLVYNQLCAL